MARVEQIVRLAMKETGLSSLRAWFNEDRNGYWHKTAERFLASVADNPKAAEMTEDAVDHEIAVMLCATGADALLKEAKGKRRRA